MPVKYKLTYFNVPALAEPARFLFAYGGIDYEDIRIPRDQWPSLKTKMPFGQIPVLEVDGKIINQSMAISRYVGRLVKLAGSTPEEDLEIDSMVDNFNDVRTKIANYAYEQDEEQKEKKRVPLINEILPFLLGKLDEAAKSGHLALGKLTWADLYFVSLMEFINYMLKSDVLEKYANLQKVMTNVKNIPAITNYIATRPKSEI